MRRGSVLFLIVALAVPPLATGQEPNHAITPDDYSSVNTITEAAISPDGKQVAYCLATWNKKADNRRSELWVVDTDGKGKPKQLTSDRANDRHPKWSADGQSIYVIANRSIGAAKGSGPSQVWRVPLNGEKPVVITKAARGVVAYDYAAQADAIDFTVDATATDADDFAALRKKFAGPQYGSGKRTVSELFRLNMKDEKPTPEKLFGENRYIREFATTANGKRIAMVTAIDDSVLKSEGESRVDVWENGKTVTPPTASYRAKASSPHAWLEHLAWNPEGNRFAFCAIHDAFPAEIILGHLSEDKWATTRMNRNGTTEVKGYGSPLIWSDATHVCFLNDKAGDSGVYEYGVESPHTLRAWSGKNRAVYGFAVAASGEFIVTIDGAATRFPELVMIPRDARKQVVLTDVNPHTKTWKLPTVEHITWKAPDGTEVGGPLELPPGWKKGDKPLPLVVAIHGGPTTSSANDLRFDPHNGRLYFAAKGYAVLCPNYRGSTGYGDKFVTDLVGNENDVEVNDILAGIQHLIKLGIADPERIAVMGWSNGGYLTNCLITLKDPPVKIRAASSGAGILDTVAEWGFNDEPAYPMVFKKGAPWEQPEIYRKTSPTYGLGNVKTPTLIHVGGNDVRCPPGHSRMLHRALKAYVDVPTELLVYPGEPHGLGKLSHRTAKMEWDLAWFEKYLKK